MMTIAGIIPVATWLKNQTVIADYAKRRENNVVRAQKICWRRRMGTSTVPSAMEWRQPSLLTTTSSDDDECFYYYKK